MVCLILTYHKFFELLSYEVDYFIYIDVEPELAWKRINLYLTEFKFDVRVHPTEFPFESLRVSDNKRFVSCEPSVMK